MWNCNWTNPAGYSGWFSAYGIFGWLLNFLIISIILYIIFNIFRAFVSKNPAHNHTEDALEILKVKLARGEINEDEYQKTKEILTS